MLWFKSLRLHNIWWLKMEFGFVAVFRAGNRVRIGEIISVS